jgi:GNAT superfamily N-acetyltransferase
MNAKVSIRYRVAGEQDIPGMVAVRFAVKENRLSDPGFLTPQMWLDGLRTSGNANSWVCELDGTIVGFSTARVREADIWALFVDPEFEGRGIGQRLLDLATQWLTSEGVKVIELSTAAQTRADGFYLQQGWERGELNARGEVVYRRNAASRTEQMPSQTH